MYAGKTVFSQLMNYLPWRRFQTCVDRYSGDYKVKKFGGLKSTLLGGEGLVTEIRGPGEVYIQTKNLREFIEWLWTLLGPKVRSRAR